jgi:hypothetical protein
MKTRDEVRNAIVEVLEEIQTMNGQPPQEIADSTCPMTDLPNFDSVHGVEASALLSAKLDCDFAAGLFFPTSPAELPLSITAIIDRVLHDLTVKERSRYGRNRNPKESNR